MGFVKINSVIQKEKECFICGATERLECHHIYAGAYRKISEEYGAKVWLCFDHHTGNHGVHRDAEAMEILKRVAQGKLMEYYGWDTAEFIRIMGQNYLMEE